MPAADEPDADAVVRALRGERGAFEVLFRRHAAGVHSLARRISGAAEADALTQDVFVRAWQKLATFRFEASFGTWLRRLAIHLLANHHRRGAAARAEVHAHEVATAPPAHELRLDLEAAIGRLPARARAVFVLHDVEGCTHDEIGDLLGIRTGTSKSQLARARRLLRDALHDSRTDP